MHTVTIELPETFTVTSRGETVTVDTIKIPSHIIARLFMHGAKQKAGDTCADKEKVEKAGSASELMNRAVNAWYAGEWSTRGESDKPTLSPIDSIIWDMIEKAVRTAIMARDKVAKVKSLTEAQLAEIADKTPKAFDKPENRDRFRAAAEAELAARNAAKALSIEL